MIQNISVNMVLNSRIVRFSQICKRFLGEVAFLLVCLLILASDVPAQNSSVAIAMPLENIVVDGDHSEWPNGLKEHYLFYLPEAPFQTALEVETDNQFYGKFKVGYIPNKNKLYFAVTIPSAKKLHVPRPHLSIQLPSTGQKTIWFETRRTLDDTIFFEQSVNIAQEFGEQAQLSPGMVINAVLGFGGYIKNNKRAWKSIAPRHWMGDIYLLDQDADGEYALALFKKDAIKDFRIKLTYMTIPVGMLIALGLVHLLLFVFYPRLKENLYYCILNVPIIAMTLSSIILGQLPMWSLQPGLGIIFISALLFLYSWNYSSLPKTFWIFVVGWVSVGIGVVIDPYEVAHPSDLWNTERRQLLNVSRFTIILSWFKIVMLPLSILEVLRIILTAIRKKRAGAGIIGIGFLGFVMTTVYILLFTRVSSFGLFGTILFLLAMSIYLARNFANTSTQLEAQLIENERLTDITLEQERALRFEMEAELKKAHELQMSLMPNEQPNIDGFDIAGRCVPATHVGGDFFQYFHHLPGRIILTLADVTGHAMEAAIPVVMFSGVLKSEMRQTNLVNRTLQNLNKAMYEDLDKRTFICFEMGEIDSSTKMLRLSNAGCPYPYHFQAKTGKCSELRVDAYPLGVRPDTEYDALEVQLEPGDYLIFCSDGIIEIENEEGEQLGFERTQALIQQICISGVSSNVVIDKILNEVHTFKNNALQGDDMTCVVVRVNSIEA